MDVIARHARERPEAEAVGDVGGARCTYGELASVVAARASCLREFVRPRGVVVAVVPQAVDFVAWFCASIAAGVHFFPMHPQIAGPEARGAAARAGAVALIGGEGLGLEPGFAQISNEAVSTDGASAERVASHRPPGAIVIGSSGTTGLPKLALRTSASLDADAAGIITGMGLTRNDRVVVATPLCHSYGVDLLVGTLTAGASLRVVGRFDAETVAAELAAGATVLPGVPFIFEALARCSAARSRSLRLALSAGSPLPRGVRDGFFDVWGVEVGQLYGATELGTVSMDVPGTAGFDAASVGRPLPGVSMRIVDVEDANRLLGAGEEGQLAVRADSMLAAYLDGEVPLTDGHLLTGDLATMDAEGRVRITGRLKLLIDVGAYKVNPLEVESVLGAHPEVVECVIVPIAASETVQRVRAVVVVRDRGRPHIAEDLREYLRDRLAPIKVPRVVELVDSLPRTTMGKVARDRV
ncbi:MAG: fatty acid--CoA ligase family protein [Phycisphaerales bacterium]|nr:fatty acid--CoA ligase family protein [Phycisphaerales bacterium]